MDVRISFSSEKPDPYVRPATDHDTVGLARVQTLGWQQGFAGLLPDDWLAGRVIDPQLWSDRMAHPLPRSALFVAERSEKPVGAELGEEIVGFALVGPAQGDPDAETTVGQLYAIYVLADHWGCGVGYHLHQAGIEALVAAGFRTARLWVLADHVRSIAFYQRQGWSADDVLRTEDLGGVEATLRRFSRPLPEGS